MLRFALIFFYCSLILITSDKVYKNIEQLWGYKETDKVGGKDIYSGSKGAAELIIKSYFHSFFNKKDHPVKVGIGRAGNVIGGGDWALDRIIVDAVKAWSKNNSVQIRCPNATRPWQHVIEPLMGYLILAEKMYLNPKKFDGPWNMGPSTVKNMTVGELISGLSSKLSSLEFKTVNNDIYEPNYLRLNSEKSKEKLGWQKVLTDEEMIDLICDWHIKYKSEDVYSLCLSQIEFYLEKFYERSS